MYFSDDRYVVCLCICFNNLLYFSNCKLITFIVQVYDFIQPEVVRTDF